MAASWRGAAAGIAGKGSYVLAMLVKASHSAPAAGGLCGGGGGGGPPPPAKLTPARHCEIGARRLEVRIEAQRLPELNHRVGRPAQASKDDAKLVVDIGR